jgi:hypothetical protein
VEVRTLSGYEATAGWVAAIGAATLIHSYLRTGRRDRAIFSIVLLALAVSVGRHVTIDVLWLHLAID